LTNASKVERYYFDSHVLNPAFVRGQLIEGLQQAGDTRLPEFTIHKRLKVFVEDELPPLAPEGARLIAFPGAGPTIADVLAQSAARRVLLAVGPEGGWTTHEHELLQRHGFCPVTMGSRILRTDTACAALLALVHDKLRA
jgi:RsmE family RNA methyltransferase